MEMECSFRKKPSRQVNGIKLNSLIIYAQLKRKANQLIDFFKNFLNADRCVITECYRNACSQFLKKTAGVGFPAASDSYAERPN